MKVLFLSPSISYGGAHKMMIWYANSLATENDVVICTYFYFETNYIISDGIEVINLGLARYSNKYLSKTIGFFVTEYNIIKTVKAVSPDVIITYGDVFSIFLTSIIKSKRSNLIICERNYPNAKLNFLTKSFKKWAFRQSDGVVFQTKYAAEYYKLHPKTKICNLPNPVIDLINNPVPWKQRRKEIAFVGRFEVEQKRQDLMLVAFDEVYNKFPDYHLVFYGDGADFGYIKKLAKEKKYGKNIKFAGKVDNIIETIRGASVFVLASEYEGIPNTLLEAMAAGLPVVATDCKPGGARMLLGESQFGLLVERGNSAAISKAIIFYLSNPNYAQHIGAMAQESCQRFDPAVTSDKWNHFISQFK
jgi:GalNAc-alpha-(1->4)-GalNAc-alpha-(1->3)-diNAcBac-PP-undecaprenol alpha-1,4-N-acetyl-D-galactosaminyltransferase